MQRPIQHDQLFLQQPSAVATPADVAVGQDLADTLAAHRANCVGLAANMIGVAKRVIVVAVGPLPLVMFNPTLSQPSQPYRTQEGCLSLPGQRPTTRYRRVTVRWRDSQWQAHEETFTGFVAQIIQHEVDHCAGILI